MLNHVVTLSWVHTQDVYDKLEVIAGELVEDNNDKVDYSLTSNGKAITLKILLLADEVSAKDIALGANSFVEDPVNEINGEILSLHIKYNVEET